MYLYNQLIKLFGYGFATAIGLGLGAGIALPKIYDHKYAKTIDNAKDTIKVIAPDKFEKFQYVGWAFSPT